MLTHPRYASQHHTSIFILVTMHIPTPLRQLLATLTTNRGPKEKARRYGAASEGTFIFTEVYRCGKIGKIALDSFAKHHPGIPVHIFGTPGDFSSLSKREGFEFHDISAEKVILQNFNYGHRGTASLWAKIIAERPEKYIIHFDSDVVVRGSVINDIQEKLTAGYALVGPRRNYQHNPNKRDDVRYLSDVVQTLFFGFDREYITKQELQTLALMCEGKFEPNGFPVIDFFDPISFDILRNGGTAFFLSPNDYGGLNEYGSRLNAFAEQNAMIDFGAKLAHFSAVGSGMNFYNRVTPIPQSISPSYVQHAKERYAVYCKLFYNEDIEVEYNREEFAALFAVNDWVQEGAHS